MNFAAVSLPFLPFPELGQPANLNNLWVNCVSANPLWLPWAKSKSDDASVGSMLDLKASAKMAVKLMEGMFKGEGVSALTGMVANCKA